MTSRHCLFTNNCHTHWHSIGESTSGHKLLARDWSGARCTLTFSPLDPSQRRVFRPRPRTTPFAATGYVVLKRTLLYESIIVHINYLLKSVNILHDINLSSSKNFLPLNIITPDFVQRTAEYIIIIKCYRKTHYQQTDACVYE